MALSLVFIGFAWKLLEGSVVVEAVCDSCLLSNRDFGSFQKPARTHESSRGTSYVLLLPFVCCHAAAGLFFGARARDEFEGRKYTARSRIPVLLMSMALYRTLSHILMSEITPEIHEMRVCAYLVTIKIKLVLVRVAFRDFLITQKGILLFLSFSSLFFLFL